MATTTINRNVNKKVTIVYRLHAYLVALVNWSLCTMWFVLLCIAILLFFFFFILFVCLQCITLKAENQNGFIAVYRIMTLTVSLLELCERDLFIHNNFSMDSSSFFTISFPETINSNYHNFQCRELAGIYLCLFDWKFVLFDSIQYLCHLMLIGLVSTLFAVSLDSVLPARINHQ